MTAFAFIEIQIWIIAFKIDEIHIKEVGERTIILEIVMEAIKHKNIGNGRTDRSTKQRSRKSQPRMKGKEKIPEGLLWM